MRITIFGDIMCEPPVLKGAKQKGAEYNDSLSIVGVKLNNGKAVAILCNRFSII